ncbi:maleylpyruvate isomerase N-terminal domain-containing protein [Nocardiopsis metallicus]|uniref:maleylpyruvate isomerase N-terminal domain-containing protein n=1 Tax=Nocardiopsis metallicus TaxID=179819 RepID=UPI0031D29E04
MQKVLLHLSESDAVLPTRCVPWDVAALSVHTVGALHRVIVSLDEVPPESGPDLVSAVGYYAPDVRFSPAVNEDRVDSAMEQAARRSDAQEAGRVLRDTWRALEPRLEAEPVDRVVLTRHGDRMLLTDFLVTRVVELVLHGLDLADALGREPWTGPAALDTVREVLFEGVDPVELERVLPGRAATAGAPLASLAAVRAVTGRAGSDVDRTALEAAGVRFLALG